MPAYTYIQGGSKLNNSPDGNYGIIGKMLKMFKENNICRKDVKDYFKKVLKNFD